MPAETSSNAKGFQRLPTRATQTATAGPSTQREAADSGFVGVIVTCGKIPHKTSPGKNKK